MKKTGIALLLVALLLLPSCSSGDAGKGTEADAETAANTNISETAASEETEQPAALTPEEAKEAALSCVGGTTDALYEKIGEPESSDYAPSCLGPGEDGNLYYDAYGFIVYTYRENGEETVRDVD